MSAHPVKARGGDPVKARRLRLGEVVHYADDRSDWGVVAAFERIGWAGRYDGPVRAIVAWHNGDVDQYTLTGAPDGTSAAPGRVWPTGLAWRHGAARALLAAALDDQLDRPEDRARTMRSLRARFGALPVPR